MVLRFWRRDISAVEAEGNILQCLWNEYTMLTFDKTCVIVQVFIY